MSDKNFRVRHGLEVDGPATIAGTATADGADIGNITVAVTDDNTITTTSGDLAITAAAGSVVAITSENTAPTSISRNTTSTNVSVRSLSLDVQSSGTPAVGFGNTLDWQVEAQPGNTERGGFIAVNLTDITPGSENFEMRFGLMENGTAYTTKMSLDSAGNLDTDGDITATGADLGNITVAVSDDNTITTTSGSLNLTASGTNEVNITSGSTTPTLITRNTSSTTGNIRALSLAVESSGTPTVGFGSELDWEVEAQPGNTERAGFIAVTSTDLTAGSEDFSMKFGLMQNGATYTTKMELDSAGNLDIDGDLTVNDAVVFAGATSGSVSIAAPAVAGSQSYTLPTALPAVTGYVLSGTTGGALSWVANPDTNTTYTIDASSTTGGANFNLVGSDATTDTIKFASGTGVTVSQTSANEIGVAIGQSVGTGDSPTFGGATLGNITVGLTDNNTITTTDTNGNLTVTPNGTGKLVVTTETDTNISDGNYILGNISATRNTAWTAPTSGLSTISSSNGISVASSTNYGAQFQVVYYSGDTTAGTNSAPNLTGRGAGGTNSAPSAVANNQVMLTLNGDGYATNNFAQNIATTNAGGGTTSIAPIQLQLYAREAFADNGTTVTNAGAGFRVRGFPTGVSMSTANRVNYIDHSPNSATYRSDTFTFQQGTTTTSTANLRSNTWNLQNSAGTTTYASFASGGATIGNVDSPSIFVRSSGTNVGTRPVAFLRNTQTATATPSTSDGASFRFQVAGSSGTPYHLGEFSGFYSSTGDSGLNVNIANGDQTGATMTSVTPFQTKLSETRIKGTSTPTATAGGNTLTDVAIFAPGATNIKSDTITLESNSGTDYLVIDANEAKFSKVIRSTTTAAGNFAGGSTYTPAATITNGVSATVNSGTGGFTIALTNLLVSGESEHYQFYVNNTSGSAQQVTTTGGVVNINHNLASGSSMMITVYIVDTAAFCEHIA